MLSVLLWVIPRRFASLAGMRPALVACLAALAGARVPAAADQSAAPLAASGVAMVPADAAFLSSSLRIRDQYDRIVKSKAFAAVTQLPAVKRAIDSYEEQRTTPGTAFSTFDTFMQLPENEQALDLLADMVATDTFVYGEPSCITFARLARALAVSQQGVPPAGGDADGITGDSADAARARQMLEALADNLDLIVVPDVVWGFRTTKRDVALSQLKRIEVLGKLFTQADPDLAKALERRQVAGGEVLTLTLGGERLPWDDIERQLDETAGDTEGADDVFDRLRGIDIVVAVGVIGDWVIISVGDSVEHLEKLALPDSGRKGLLALPAFAPLLAHADKPLTGISYVSQALGASQAPSPADVDAMLPDIGRLGGPDGLSAEAEEDIRELAQRAAGEYGKLLPEPAPWMAFSFLAEQGYEGYVWNWARNQPFDGSKRLDILEHAGGAPLAVLVSRVKSDPEAFDTIVDLAGAAWRLFGKHGRPRLNAEESERFDEFAEHVAPLGGKLATILRDKILAGLADGQVGMVIDAKGRTKRLQGELPASAEPLPLVEPAIVLPLDDPKLFRDGLSDLFALGDELTEAIRAIDPDAVPEGYRIPEPEKAKVDAGTLWSWKLDKSRLDDQIRPAIGVGEKAVVFSLVPTQAGRMLVESRLETGSQLTRFDEPLAGAAAVDFAGLVDALQPWIVYLTRYGCVQERDGVVDPDGELTADDENEQAKEVLEHASVVLEAIKSLRAAVAESSFRDDALVTHWRNVIRDTPAPR
jgi:hypothetical protein